VWQVKVKNMKSTLEALSRSDNSILSLMNEEDNQQLIDISAIVRLHLRQRQVVLKQLYVLTEQKIQNSIDNDLILELNRLATDYMSCSQFALLPHLCERLSQAEREQFIENGIAFSYLTNVICERPELHAATSKLMELLSDRIIMEDRVLKKVISL
jgi:hypothetical protein